MRQIAYVTIPPDVLDADPSSTQGQEMARVRALIAAYADDIPLLASFLGDVYPIAVVVCTLHKVLLQIDEKVPVLYPL